MKTKKKLAEYFKETGVQKTWLADKLGMSDTQMWMMGKGVRPVPQKYWKGLVEYTQGYVTYQDLFYDFLAFYIKRCPDLKLKEHEDGGQWLVVPKQTK